MVMKFHFKLISKIQNKGLIPQSCHESTSLPPIDINTRTPVLATLKVGPEKSSQVSLSHNQTSQAMRGITEQG